MNLNEVANYRVTREQLTKQLLSEFRAPKILYDLEVRPVIVSGAYFAVCNKEGRVAAFSAFTCFHTWNSEGWCPVFKELEYRELFDFEFVKEVYLLETMAIPFPSFQVKVKVIKSRSK